MTVRRAWRRLRNATLVAVAVAVVGWVVAIALSFTTVHASVPAASRASGSCGSVADYFFSSRQSQAVITSRNASGPTFLDCDTPLRHRFFVAATVAGATTVPLAVTLVVIAFWGGSVAATVGATFERLERTTSGRPRPRP